MSGGEKGREEERGGGGRERKRSMIAEREEGQQGAVRSRCSAVSSRIRERNRKNSDNDSGRVQWENGGKRAILLSYPLLSWPDG